MEITHPLDFIVTGSLIGLGSANVIALDMPPYINFIKLLIVIAASARLGYTLAKHD